MSGQRLCIFRESLSRTEYAQSARVQIFYPGPERNQPKYSSALTKLPGRLSEPMRFDDYRSPSRDEPFWSVIEEFAPLNSFPSDLLKHIIVWSSAVDCLTFRIEHGLSPVGEIQGVRDNLHIFLICLFQRRMRSDDRCHLPANNQKRKQKDRQSGF